MNPALKPGLGRAVAVKFALQPQRRADQLGWYTFRVPESWGYVGAALWPARDNGAWATFRRQDCILLYSKARV